MKVVRSQYSEKVDEREEYAGRLRMSCEYIYTDHGVLLISMILPSALRVNTRRQLWWAEDLIIEHTCGVEPPGGIKLELG